MVLVTIFTSHSKFKIFGLPTIIQQNKTNSLKLIFFLTVMKGKDLIESTGYF